MHQIPASLRTGLLCNPTSGFVRKNLHRIRLLTSQIPAFIYRETSGPDHIEMVIDEFKQMDIELIIIIGGDGTVQAILNHLLNRSDFNKLPLISIIPAGTTNMTARDLGYRGSPEKILKKLVKLHKQSSTGKLVSRPALRIKQADSLIVHGMFFGTGIIASGVKFFHTNIKKSGLTGEFTSAIVILYLLAGLLFNRSAAELSPACILMTDDNGEKHEKTCLIMFASTMDRLLLGMRPYWGKQQEPIHTTYIRSAPSRLWRSLLMILAGRGIRLAEANGYYSRNNRRLELLMDEDFIVDGEFYRADRQHGPLHISVTDNIDFLIP